MKSCLRTLKFEGMRLFLFFCFVLLWFSPSFIKAQQSFSQWQMLGFSHQILPKSLVWNVKLFWGFIGFLRNVIRNIYKWKKWRENIIWVSLQIKNVCYCCNIQQNIIRHMVLLCEPYACIAYRAYGKSLK